MNRFSYNIKLDEHIFKVVIERDEDKWHAYCPILEDLVAEELVGAQAKTEITGCEEVKNLYNKDNVTVDIISFFQNIKFNGGDV